MIMTLVKTMMMKMFRTMMMTLMMTLARTMTVGTGQTRQIANRLLLGAPADIMSGNVLQVIVIPMMMVMMITMMVTMIMMMVVAW